jgi:hypothetical protein
MSRPTGIMRAMTAPPSDVLPSPFEQLLRQAFALYRRALPSTAPLALLAALPGLRPGPTLPSLPALSADPEGATLAFIEPMLQARFWWELAAALLFALWLHAALLLRMRGEQEQTPVSLGAALWRGLLRLPAFVSATLAWLLACALPLPLLMLLMGVLGAAIGSLPLLVLAAMAAGAMFSLPICWLALRFLFAPYLGLLGPCAPWTALMESGRRVRGRMWMLLGYVSVPMTLWLCLGLLPRALPGPPQLQDFAAVLLAALAWPLLHASLLVAMEPKEIPNRAD